MAIKNINSPPYNGVPMNDITWEQQRKYPNYTKDELQRVKQALSTPEKLKYKMKLLLEEIKMCQDFQIAVPRDKNYRTDDIDHEFDTVIDGLECVIQATLNYEDELKIGESISKNFDSRFYARR